jgi:RNA polymerase sigma factor (sigma-70 family)
MSEETGSERLSRLFASHYDEVLAYCARRVGRDEAEGAAADVFAVAARRVDEIDWSTARPWLYGVARGVLANRWRSIHRRRRLVDRVTRLARMPIDGPDQVVVRDLEARAAVQALHGLRSTDREILMLSAWEDLTGPQIANSLGISVAAAEKRLERAKRRFAVALRATPGAPAPRGLGVEETRSQ